MLFTIIISVGMNDSRWFGLPSEKNPEVSKRRFQSNMEKLIKQAKKFSTKVCVIGISPVDEAKTLPFESFSYENSRIAEFNDAIQSVCTKQKVHFLDIFSIMLHKDHEELISDGVHPNEKGYKLMFENVKKFLEENKLI